MIKILTPVRFCAMIGLVLIYLGFMSIVYLVVRSHWGRVRWSNRILTRFCRGGLRILDVRVKHYDYTAVAGSVLFVGNHLSYLDVLCLHAVTPACFVTSREIRETPVLGQICLLAGCLFVERRSRAGLRGEVGQLAGGLERGFSVAIFPEATSGNGERLLKFKRPLFAAAERARRPVIPFCLNYHTVGGRPIDRISRDRVFWYGDMGFAPHLWALCGAGGVEVDLTFSAPIGPDPELDGGTLSELSERAIGALFKPV